MQTGGEGRKGKKGQKWVDDLCKRSCILFYIQLTLQLVVGWLGNVDGSQNLKDNCFSERAKGFKFSLSQVSSLQAGFLLNVGFANVCVKPLLPYTLHQPHPVQVGALVVQKPVHTCPEAHSKEKISELVKTYHQRGYYNESADHNLSHKIITQIHLSKG